MVKLPCGPSIPILVPGLMLPIFLAKSPTSLMTSRRPGLGGGDAMEKGRSKSGNRLGATVIVRGHPARPPYTPELQPAETLWVHVDEPIANKHDTLSDLDAAVAAQCVAINADCSRVKGQAGFHWWPERVVKN